MNIYKKLHQQNHARAGLLQLAGHYVPTPVFMPVGTRASVKALTTQDLFSINYFLILSNSYHLCVRPGDELIAKVGGLHKFMNWKRLILTDSGGFQVFSLQKFRKVLPSGVEFQSHLDGTKIFFTPQKVINIQQNLGSDIMMVLDECLHPNSSYDKTASSMERTISWAKIALEYKKQTTEEKKNPKKQALFGIVQGGMFEDLRLQCLQKLQELEFDGYAIGGLSVGESKEDMIRILESIAPQMPAEKPRYLMGVGHPVDILQAVANGIDMFDSVLPTRNARNGSYLTPNGWLSIKKKEFAADTNPIDRTCDCFVCKNYSRSYLRHLFQRSEILSCQLGSYHNLYFMQNFMQQTRNSILENRFVEFQKNFSYFFLKKSSQT